MSILIFTSAKHHGRVTVTPEMLSYVEGDSIIPRHVNYHGVDPAEIHCMALNIYYESKGEPVDGQWAVGRVTQERWRSGFADSICDVVYQGTKYRSRLEIANNAYGQCQFSWACIGETPRMPRPDAYQQAYEIAYQILVHGARSDWLEGVHYFHADYVNPGWRRHFQPVTKIGAHIFYRDTRHSPGI